MIQLKLSWKKTPRITVYDLSFLCHSPGSGMKRCLLIYPTVVMSYRSTHHKVPAWDIFPVVLGEVYYYFFSPAKERGSWEGNLKVSVLHPPYTISVVAAIRDYCNVSLARRGERAGAACEANLLKALAPNFTTADTGKHSITVLWSTRLPSQSKGSSTLSSVSLRT